MADYVPTAKRPRAGEPSGTTSLVHWLRDRGAKLDGLDIRATPGGSLCVVATRVFEAGEAFGELPASAIIDPTCWLAEDKVAIAAMELGGSRPFAFWLSLASAARDSAHPFAPYLGSLPREAPDPCAWPAADRALLEGTPLATQTEAQRRMLADEFARVGAGCAPGVSLDEVVWARGVHQSRCFPLPLARAAQAAGTRTGALPHGEGASDVLALELGALDEAGPNGVVAGAESPVAPAAEAAQASEQRAAAEAEAAEAEAAEAEPCAEGEEEGLLGCMLPLYDLLDHRPGQPILWEAGGGAVRFRCRERVRTGETLANNYGARPNSELLSQYGFASAANAHDCVEGVLLGCPAEESEALGARRVRELAEHGVPHACRAGGTLVIGPFTLGAAHGRGAAGCGGEETRAPPAAHAADGVERGGVLPAELLFALQVVGLEDADDELALTPDELSMLCAVLEHRLGLLDGSDARDQAAAAEGGTRAAYCAHYRNGQRRILRAAIAEVEAMMASVAEDDDGASPEPSDGGESSLADDDDDDDDDEY